MQWMKAVVPPSINFRKKVLQAITSAPSSTNGLAAAVDRFQLTHNLTLRRWRSMHRSALPIVAYKETSVCCFQPTQSHPWFESSGTTTAGRNVNSRHRFRSLDLYRASVVEGWRWQMKQRGLDCDRINFAAIMPSFRENAHSSLSCMMQILMDEFGQGDRFWAMRKMRWDWNGLRDHLLKVMKQNRRMVIFGTAFGWVHFLDWCETRKVRFGMPPDTLVFETGGYKGRSRELERSELHQRLASLLGLQPSQVCSEYSMCELSSQAYSFRRRSRMLFRFPPWCRYRVALPGSSTKAAIGKRGVLEIHDLANLDSCARIRTEDMAIDWGTGFELLGRLPQAGLKGCSLSVEDS